MNNKNEFLYVSSRDINCVFDDKHGDNYKLSVPQRMSNLCSALFLRPGLSSRMRGSWNREDIRTLTEEEAQKEVGWLWKNTTAEEHERLSELNAKNLLNEYFHDARYLELVEATKKRLGKIRTSRMRSDYTPISETKKL